MLYLSHTEVSVDVIYSLLKFFMVIQLLKSSSKNFEVEKINNSFVFVVETTQTPFAHCNLRFMKLITLL